MLLTSIAVIESQQTDGPAGPWCGYLIRARAALEQACADFVEHAHFAQAERSPQAIDTH